MSINRSTRQRTSGTAFNGCQSYSLTFFCYDDMLRKGYYSTEYKNSTDRYYYTDWPLTNVTINLYLLQSNGTSKLIDTQITNSSGYVTFTSLKRGDYYISLVETEFSSVLWGHIYPNFTDEVITIGNGSPSNQTLERGWYYNALSRLYGGLTPPNSCLNISSCGWFNNLYSCCSCGTFIGYPLATYFTSYQNYICGYTTSNSSGQTYVGNYGGLRMRLDPYDLTNHVFAFDASWRCYSTSVYGNYYYSPFRIENGLVLIFNGNASYPYAQCIRSGQTIGSSDSFSMKIQTTGTVGAMTMVDVVAACHVYCTYCSSSQKYYMGVSTALYAFMPYISLQSH